MPKLMTKFIDFKFQKSIDFKFQKSTEFICLFSVKICFWWMLSVFKIFPKNSTRVLGDVCVL